MGGTFEHVIMTRFNLATPGRESAIRNRPGWLAERFALFERYCLPSVAGQTCRNFHWILYFDAATPPEFRDRIEACRRIFPFVPYFTGLFPASGWPRSIHETFAFQPDMLLTTRLDNDDALALDYVERVQAAVRQAGLAPGGYNFTNGCILGDGALYRLAHPSNAFFSFLAPYRDEVVTAPSIQHMDLARHGAVRQIGGPGAWMQIVHGGNVSNKIRGQRITAAEIDGAFPAGLVAEVKPVGRAARMIDTIVSGSLRGARDGLLAARRRLRRS